MVALIFLFFNLVASLFKSKSRLDAENAALRQQLTVLQRKVRGRVQFTNRIGCSRLIPRSRQAESARRGVYQRGDVGKNQLGNVTP